MNDFDFYIGTWSVACRRLVNPLSGSDEWIEFPARSSSHTFFNGAGSFEEITFPTFGWTGAAVRTFNSDRREWTINWLDSRDPRFQPPVVGRFVDGRGEFLGDDLHEGTPIRLRLLWHHITATSARWEQAFSVDGEQTWETNWVMDFTRTG